jgi:hypothetical protein
MKVLQIETTNGVEVVVRHEPLTSDVLILQLRNETTDETDSNTVGWVKQRDRLVISIPTNEPFFKLGAKYEMTLRNGDTVIYRGKAIVVAQGTDIQNYTPSKHKIQRFKTKD